MLSVLCFLLSLQQTGRTRRCEFARLFMPILASNGLPALAVDVDTDDGPVDDHALAIVGRDDAEGWARCNRPCPRHGRCYPSKFPTNLHGSEMLRVIW